MYIYSNSSFCFLYSHIIQCGSNSTAEIIKQKKNFFPYLLAVKIKLEIPGNFPQLSETPYKEVFRSFIYPFFSTQVILTGKIFFF